ncbi:MAG: acyltransferase [Pirellulaceae bacterium]
MSASLSPRAKQTFQTVSLLATVMVVGIHYRSVTCDSDLLSQATANQLSQEFLLGGIARVAVPMFAFAAGLFYFQSFDGTWSCYRKKLQQRIRSVAFPYFIIASVAIIFWLSVRKWEGEAVHLSVPQLLSMWWLRPPVEQLWFLRDLMVLVLIAPFVSLMVNRIRRVGLVVVALLWFGEIQPFPQVAGWYLLNNETLFFFALGCSHQANRSAGSNMPTSCQCEIRSIRCLDGLGVGTNADATEF